MRRPSTTLSLREDPGQRDCEDADGGDPRLDPRGVSSVVLVDTSVLLDVIEDDPEWADWSQRQVASAKHSVLPDFFIGAHAAVNGMPILTRDVRRYRNYFPTVRLISPT